MPDAFDESLDVMVVGAGQAGLATGYFLQHADMRFCLFDRSARIGDSWRQRYDSLVLFSPRAYDALPDWPMRGDPEGYPDKEEMAEYLEEYAHTRRLPVALNEDVSRLGRDQDRFVALTSRGRRIVSRAVVVTTGAFQRNVVPLFAARLAPDVVQVRANEYCNPRQLPEGRVLVVGGGASGRQIALELSRSHRVALSVGASITITPQRVLGCDVIAWFDRLGFLRADKATARGRFARANESFPGLHLRDGALRRSGVRLRARTMSAESNEFAFADGTRETFDAVIWAAGYTDAAEWLRVPGAVDSNGRYIEDRGVSPVSGLFYVGRSWQTCRASALLCGVAADAATIVTQVDAWVSRTFSLASATRVDAGAAD